MASTISDCAFKKESELQFPAVYHTHSPDYVWYSPHPLCPRQNFQSRMEDTELLQRLGNGSDSYGRAPI